VRERERERDDDDDDDDGGGDGDDGWTVRAVDKLTFETWLGT
jgi:hypothetical protein